MPLGSRVRKQSLTSAGGCVVVGSSSGGTVVGCSLPEHAGPHLLPLCFSVQPAPPARQHCLAVFILGIISSHRPKGPAGALFLKQKSEAAPAINVTRRIMEHFCTLKYMVGRWLHECRSRRLFSFKICSLSRFYKLFVRLSAYQQRVSQ